jgi:hypothetical protein
MKTVLIVPAWSDQAGQCRIVAKSGSTRNPLKDYRDRPDQWQEVGLMNSRGELVCYSGLPFEIDEIKECQPLSAGMVFEFD